MIGRETAPVADLLAEVAAHADTIQERDMLRGVVAAVLALCDEAERRYGHPCLATWAIRAAITDAEANP